LKKSKFTAPLIVGREETVSYRDFIDKALQLLVDDFADGVRWDKVARIKGALANRTYDVSAENLAGRIVGSKGAEAQVALHACAFDHWSSLKQCLMRLSKSSWLRAVKLHPDVRLLVISGEGRQRPFGCATFTLSFSNPIVCVGKCPGYWTGMTTRPSIRDEAFH
jgi:hypothetical protein